MDKPYKVKAFNGVQTIEQTFSTRDEALKLYDKYADDGCPAYLYENDEMTNSFDPIYDEYCHAAFGTTCVYCGGSAGGGYCWLSPDGNHVEQVD